MSTADLDRSPVELSLRSASGFPDSNLGFRRKRTNFRETTSGKACCSYTLNLWSVRRAKDAQKPEGLSNSRRAYGPGTPSRHGGRRRERRRARRARAQARRPGRARAPRGARGGLPARGRRIPSSCHPLRSEEHTSELQSRLHLVCRLLLEKT